MAISVENIRSLTDFRRHSKDYIEELHESKLPMVLTVNGEAAVVVEDAKAFQERQDKLTQLEEELQRLKLEALQHDIQLGIDQVEAGQFTTYTEEEAGNLVNSIKLKGRARKAKA